MALDNKKKAHLHDDFSYNGKVKIGRIGQICAGAWVLICKI
jgi:hypothetical protein